MPSVSAAQHRAMEASAHGHSTLGIPKKIGKEFVAADSAPIGAGTVFVAPDGCVLLLKRAGEEGKDNFVGHWALPGGKADAGETAEQAADRENREELGDVDYSAGKRKLLSKVNTPNGMVFHTFAQPVGSKFSPKLNDEHSESGWFPLDELPRPMHPAVRATLGEQLGIGLAEDMKPEDWASLRENFAKWTREEEAEPEHKGPRHHHDLTPADDYADDNQPQLATTANTGIPLVDGLKKKKKIAADALCSCMGKGCEKCGKSGKAFVTDTRKKQPVIPGSMATAAMRSKPVGRAFDMALFMRNMLATDSEFNEGDHPRAPDGKFGTGSGSGKKASETLSNKEKGPGPNGAKSEKAKAPIKMSTLEKKGSKLGSNEGGVYEGAAGEKFYVKKPATKAHVKNERQAAALYQLAGAKTLDYRDVEGGDHVATEWKKLEKKNISEFTPAERKEAAKDFAIHAWLSNWDAAGTGGDNQGVLNGKTTTLDVGGSLRYRAQGGAKGGAFGDKVSEFDTLRDKGMNPDAARLFAPMTESELKSSVERVMSIPDAKIRAAVGDDKELADRLIARKKDLASKVGLAMDSRKAPEHTLVVRYDGDFSFKGLLAHLQRLGSIGASRTIEARDEDDKIVPFGWDGDGADKILDAELDGEQLAFDRVMVMGLHREGLAFDRAPDSVRTIDADGRMHVEVSNISKATINPYLGKEIPKYKALGLEPNRVYQLLRDPEELRKGAPTFNNLPLLDEHVGVNAANHRPEHVIGSTGTDSVFNHPHLKNSMVVWAERGIKAIESKKKKELSSAYRYRADMTPGIYEGVRYDGVMRDIVGNHVALVEEGRAGSDVVVGDSLNPLIKEKIMKALKLSALGTVAYGSLMTFLRPQLAMDAKFDLKRGLRNINSKNFKAKRPVLAAWINESVKDKLDPEYAQDGALNSDGLDAVLDMIELACDDFPDDMKEKAKEKAKDEKPMAGAKDDDMEDEDADMDAEDDAETDEEKAARMKKRADDKKAKDKKAKDAKRAKDKDVNEEDEEHDSENPKETANDEDDEEKEAAMDAQIERRVKDGIKKERDRMEAISVAKDHVRGRVGNLTMAFDSAAQVYGKAIEMASGKKPPKTVDVDMLKFAFDALPSKDGNKHRATYAMDSAASHTAAGDIAKRSPSLAGNIARISRQ